MVHYEGSCFRISTVEISLDLFVVSFQLSLPFSLALRLAIHCLVILAFSGDSDFLCSSFSLIFFLFDGVEHFPHLANLSSDFRDSVPWEFVFYLGVDVHAIEEEGAHRLLWWLWLVKIPFSAHTFFKGAYV
jgi:hypothetical protein